MKTVLFGFDGVLRRRAFSGWRAALVVAALPVVVAVALTPGQWPLVARLVTRIGTPRVPGDVLRRRLVDFGRQVAREPGRVVAQGVDAVRRHLSAGDRAVVVTACEQTLARSVLDVPSFDVTQHLSGRSR